MNIFNNELSEDEITDDEEYMEFDFSLHDLTNVEDILEECRDFKQLKSNNFRQEYYDNNNILNINDNNSNSAVLNNIDHNYDDNYHDNNIDINLNGSTSHDIKKQTKKNDFYDFENCCTFRGEFYHDKPHGFGIIKLRNGQKFHGDFIHGKKK